MNDKTVLKAWGMVLVIFLVIAVLAIGLIFQPVKIKTTETLMTPAMIMAPSATTTAGLKLRAEAWKVYPQYNAGLGLIVIIAFVGSVYTCNKMYSMREHEET